MTASVRSRVGSSEPPTLAEASAPPTAPEVGSAEAVVDHVVEHGPELDGEAERDAVVEVLRSLDKVEQRLLVGVISGNKLVQVGTSGAGFDLDFAVFRYHLDGTMDTTFGPNGMSEIVDLGGVEVGLSIAIDAFNDIVVGGRGGSGQGPTSESSNMLLARYCW